MLEAKITHESITTQSFGLLHSFLRTSDLMAVRSDRTHKAFTRNEAIQAAAADASKAPIPGRAGQTGPSYRPKFY